MRVQYSVTEMMRTENFEGVVQYEDKRPVHNRHHVIVLSTQLRGDGGGFITREENIGMFRL